LGSFGSRMSLAATVNGGNGILKRQALAIKTENGERYVAGLKWIRVKTKQQALALFHLGQADRQVFATAQNRLSSRSHSIFEIKIIKVKNTGPTVRPIHAVLIIARITDRKRSP
jgi:kinesin family protein 20